MELNLITTLGLVAGTLTTIAYLPQLIKTWRTKSAEDLSWSMLITLCVGIILWLIYGFYVGDLPLICANIVTLIFSSIILVLKIRYQASSSASESLDSTVRTSSEMPVKETEVEMEV